jgi:Recombinase
MKAAIHATWSKSPSDSAEQVLEIVILGAESAPGSREVLRLQELRLLIESSGVRVTTWARSPASSACDRWADVAPLLQDAERAEHRLRTQRGLQGALQCNRMAGRPPTGLRIKRHLTRDGRADGISWEVDPVKGPIVRDIYRMRCEGKAAVEIAAALNARLGASPLGERDGMTWRPATIRALLRNPIFKGQFVFRGSPPNGPAGKSVRGATTELVYARPECRLVSDETWALANNDRQRERAMN